MFMFKELCYEPLNSSSFHFFKFKCFWKDPIEFLHATKNRRTKELQHENSIGKVGSQTFSLYKSYHPEQIFGFRSGRNSSGTLISLQFCHEPVTHEQLSVSAYPKISDLPVRSILLSSQINPKG